MTISIKHKFTNPKADGGDATIVRPTNWNDEHDLTLATDKLLGRATAGTGAVEEITCTAAGRALLDDVDAAAQRTTLGALAAGAVTTSGLTQNTDRLLGRTTASSGAIEEISTGAGLALNSTVLSLIGPVFSVHKNSVDQTGVADNVYTKITFSTERFDTNNNFSTANSRFTPTVAGYYFFTGTVFMSTSTMFDSYIAVYKNGTVYAEGNYNYDISSDAAAVLSTIIYMNGSTDYVELWATINGSGTGTINGNPQYTHFSGCFLRGT